jgi:hemoglobin/transferrin/lactoferrin receptor protein
MKSGRQKASDRNMEKKVLSSKSKHAAIAAGLFLLQGAIGQAAEIRTMDRIIVTARGVESTDSQTPGGTAVLESPDLFQARDASISNTLRKIPGVEKSSDSAWGSAINIRGLGRNRVVFLIDGCRVNTATDVNAQLGFVNPDEIERIEVLKGPISSLYGSGSMGGVVNVITKKGEFTPETGFAGRTGASLGTNAEGYSVFADTSLNSRDYWGYAFASKRDFDSYEDGDGRTIDNSQFEDYSLSLKSGYRWNDANVTELNIQYMEGEDIGIPGRGLALPAGPEIIYPETHRTLAGLTHKLSPGPGVWSESQVNLFYQEIDRNVFMDFPPGAPMDTIRPSALHTTWGAKWQNVLDFESQSLVAGLDIWSWEIESSREKNLSSGLTGIDTPLADAAQVSAGVFIEDNIVLSSEFTLNLGGRLDYVGTESDELYNWVKPPSPAIPIVKKRDSETTDDLSWNAHAGLTWNFSAPWTTTLLGAAGYRAPDLMERYKYLAFAGGEIYGNPELDPERSCFAEWGLHYRKNPFRMSASVYANFLEDLIAEAFESEGVYRMENVDEAEIFGAELEAQWYFVDQWVVYATAAWTEGKNRTDDEDLPFIPPLNGMFGIAFDSVDSGPWFDLNLEWAARQDEVAPGETETPGWAVVNAKAGFRFKAGPARHDLMLGVDNLFDKRYANHLSTSRNMELTEPGINLYAAWQMEF